jgi:hypothetical protein
MEESASFGAAGGCAMAHWRAQKALGVLDGAIKKSKRRELLILITKL